MRQVPGFVARRVYNHRSLRNVAGGATFRLRNEFQDAAVQRVPFVRVDGGDIPLARVSLEVAGRIISAEAVSRQAPFAVRKGAQVTVFLKGLVLAQGEHRLEIALEVAGLGAGALAVTDEV